MVATNIKTTTVFPIVFAVTCRAIRSEASFHTCSGRAGAAQEGMFCCDVDKLNEDSCSGC